MESPSSTSKHFISIIIDEYTQMEESSFPFKKYCQFSINIKSNKKSWKIFKRYKNFDDLQNSLIRKKLCNLPKLPPKRIFLSDADMKERISKLQKYLSNLLSRADVYKHEEILNFICIEKEEFLMLKENIEDLNTSDESPKSLSKFRSFNMNLKKSKSSDVLINDNFYFGNEEENEREIQSETKIFITTFLKLLNSNILEKCKTIKDFEDSFRMKGTNKVIQREEVYRLIFGEKVDGVSLQGILYHSGNIKDNQIGAESCLLFISKLISSTYNTECELFKSILKLARLSSIQELNLESHLKSNRKQVVFATLNIVKILVNEEKGIFLNKLLSETLVENYRNILC
jgi:hypothetical protein